MNGDSILNYVFDYDMCLSIGSFSKTLSASTADVYIVMSRKAACFISFLKKHGKVSFDGKLVTDRILDFDTEWLRGKNVIVVDDVIVSGTTIFSVIQKLNNAGVCSIKVYVLGVNECFFNPDILQYTDSNQQVVSYLEPPYIPLSDAACMRACSNIVSTFALDILPYDVDFPKHELFSVSKSIFNQLVASSDWYSYDVSSDLQAENNIKNVTMLPGDRIKALFDQETGMPISNLGFFKIRLFARLNEKRGKYLINVIPYFLFNAITSRDISVMFDTWFADVPIKPESNIAKIRILQYVLAEKLFKIWTKTLNTIVPNKIDFHLNLAELALVIPDQFHTAIIQAIDCRICNHQPLESFHKSPYFEFKEEHFESKIVTQEDQKDNMAVLQTKLVEPFTSLYFSKEKESRESVLRYGKKAFEMPEYQSIIDRLNHGYSYRALIHLLDEYPDIYDKETTVSLFIDEAIDAGVIVPIIAEEKDGGEIFYFRAYRHGEDVPFGELQEKLCAIMLSAYANEGGSEILTNLRIEKMLALFIHIGLTQRIFRPSPQDSIYYNVNVDAYLQGNVTTVQDPTSKRSYHYLKHRSDATWLSSVLVDKGIILMGENGGRVTAINDNIDIDVDNSTRGKVSGIGKTFAQLYKNSTTKAIPYINDRDLVLFSTCMFPRDILNALGAELAIFEDRWNKIKKHIKSLLFTTPSQIVSEITTREIYEAINSGQIKFFNFLEKRAQKRIDEISSQFANSETLNIYGVLWDQFWPDNRNWNIDSIDPQLFNTILNEGKILLIFNILCRMLFLCVSDVSNMSERETYVKQIVEYQEKLKYGAFDKSEDVQEVLCLSKTVLDKQSTVTSFDLEQSLDIWDKISYYSTFVPALLSDVELLVDRHGKTCTINRYVHAIHLKIPEEMFSSVGGCVEEALGTKEIEYQLFPIAEPTAIFPECGLWFFLKKGKINDIVNVLSKCFSCFPTLRGAKVFYKLSENLRLKMVEGINTKHQFGKFSSYAYETTKMGYKCEHLSKGQVLWIIEDSRGNLKEMEVLEGDRLPGYFKSNKTSLPFHTTVASQAIVFDFKQRTNIEKYRKGFIAMESKCKVFVSYSEDSAEHVSKVKTIVDRLRYENFEVYFYEDEPFGTDMIKFMRNLNTCDIALIIGTPEYKKRAYEIDSSGVSFEDRILAGGFMSEHRDKIVPIAFGAFKECIPAPFDTLKGMSMQEITVNQLDTLVAGLMNRYIKNSRSN